MDSGMFGLREGGRGSGEGRADLPIFQGFGKVTPIDIFITPAGQPLCLLRLLGHWAASSASFCLSGLSLDPGVVREGEGAGTRPSPTSCRA